CPHAVLDGVMLVQHLVDGGGLVLDQTTGQTTYTDGSGFWTVDADGQLTMSSEPPAGVLPALLSVVPPPLLIDLSPKPAPTIELPAPIPPLPTPVAVPAPSAGPHAPFFFSDPRLLAVTIPDLPGGARAWVRIGDDTTRLLQFQYSVIYGRMPGNGQLYPLDPAVAINVLVADTVEHASEAWQGTYAKPGKGQRTGGVLPAIADEQTYALGTNLIDVHARQYNVILQAIEWTNGTRSISLDDPGALVRMMAPRGGDRAQ